MEAAPLGLGILQALEKACSSEWQHQTSGWAYRICELTVDHLPFQPGKRGFRSVKRQQAPSPLRLCCQRIKDTVGRKSRWCVFWSVIALFYMALHD